MTFRFAIFAAVSREEQVIDKDSLSNQVNDGRAYGDRLGGKETAGPFIADGYSRSFYEGLGEAMAEIPPLREAMRAAEHNQYDVLIVRYFERLGVVAYPVFLRLAKFRKQFRSVQESTPIVPPQIYDPTKDEATSTMIHLSGLKQDYRINRLINNLRENMPKRIREGLTPSRMPYGYVYVNNKTPPKLDPEKAAKLIQARDMLMTGDSLVAIGKLLGVDHSRVRTVLSNPYYMGQVSYNKTYIQRLGTKRTQVRQPKSKWLIGQGRHLPVFTQEEHEAILAELDRREQVMRRHEVGFMFSGLLRCDVCGDRARRNKFGSPSKYKQVIICRAAGAKHIRYDYDEFISIVAGKIQTDWERQRNGEWVVEEEDKSDIIRQAIEANKRRRAKVQEGFETGIYDAPEASTKLRELERAAERLHADLEKITADKVARRDVTSSMEKIDLSNVPEWLATESPKEVNRILSTWLKEIRIRDDDIKLIKR